MKFPPCETAVSEIVGEMLILTIVLILVAVFAVNAGNLLPPPRDPSVNILLESSGSNPMNITLYHKGGDWVRRSDLTVIVSWDKNATHFRSDKFILEPEKAIFDLGSKITVSDIPSNHAKVSLVTPRKVIFPGRYKGMNDNAIAPVVAVMLILAVAVTIFSVYNAEYLPGLKQQAEVEHLQKVEESMERFGSALENAIAMKRTMFISEPVVLGGGDILLNSAKSSGTIRVQQEDEPVITILINNAQIPLYFVNFSYYPIDNFWVDQGYSWQYGYINVSRVSAGGMYDPVPLKYTTMDKVYETLQNSSLPMSLINIEQQNNNWTLFAVNLVQGAKNFSSGNCIASFCIRCKYYRRANV